MRTRRQATIQDLRRAIDRLPRDTRIAMLDGVRANDIIAGAYSDRNGICPMLAAHRAGGRTSCISFAKAWDRFVFRNARRASARRATQRELLVLTAHLEASLLDDDRADLAPVPKDRPGDPDRGPELEARPGWAWLRVIRRYDEYERALARLGSQAAAERQRAAEREPELEPSR
jgi:hypothetical protein